MGSARQSKTSYHLCPTGITPSDSQPSSPRTRRPGASARCSSRRRRRQSPIAYTPFVIGTRLGASAKTEFISAKDPVGVAALALVRRTHAMTMSPTFHQSYVSHCTLPRCTTKSCCQLRLMDEESLTAAKRGLASRPAHIVRFRGLLWALLMTSRIGLVR